MRISLKRISLFLVLSAFLFSITSCSSDDDDEGRALESGILGYWEFVMAEPVEVIAKDAQSIEKIENYIRRYNGTDWAFFKDGKTLEYELYKGKVIEYEGKYKVNGSLLTRTPMYDAEEEGTPYTDKMEINGNSLVITVDDTKEVQMDYPNADVTRAIVAFKYTRKK